MADPTAPAAAAAPAAPAPAAAIAAAPAHPGPRTWKQRLHSASWWVGVATVCAELVNALTGSHVPIQAVATVAGVVASMIIGTGLPE